MVKINRRIAVMLAEIIELWVEDCDSDDSDNYNQEKVKIRLYACPQDTPNGRNHTHGEVSSYVNYLTRQVKDMLSWRC